MKKIILILIFAPIISWGQDIALVKLLSSEIIEYPSTPNCGSLDWQVCENDSICNVMKLTFRVYEEGYPTSVTLVLYHQIHKLYGIDEQGKSKSIYYIFPWETLKEQLIYIEYELDSQFKGILMNKLRW